MNEKKFYVAKTKLMKNFNVMHQMLIAGPMLEYEANDFALKQIKISRRGELYHVLEMVSEPNASKS